MTDDMAEELSSRLEDFIYHIKAAIEEVKGSACDVAQQIGYLDDIIAEAKQQKDKCDEILDEQQRKEIAYLNRQYERSVI